MSNETETAKKSSNAGKIIIIVAALIIIALLAVIVVLLLKGNKEPEAKRDDVAARGTVVNQSNAEQVVDDMVLTPYVEPGYYEASMTNVWHFADGESVSEDAYVANVEGNTNDVYFDVFLATDEENPITELLDEVEEGIYETRRRAYDDALLRVNAVMEQASKVPIASWVDDATFNWIGPAEKKGVCHILVNDERFKWVEA